MKKFRKLTAVITALCLAGSMMATMSMLNVSAEGESTTYSITITNDGDKATHTYEAYQIFAGSLSGTGTDTDPYILSNITWGNGIDTTTTVDNNTLLNAIKEISVDNGNTTPFSSVTDASSVATVLSSYSNDDAEVQAFADVVGKYLSSTKTGTYDNGKINGLSAGYYLVQDASNPTGSDTNSGAKTRYILKVAGDVAVETKNSAPSVMKKVKENEKYTDTNAKDDRMSSVTLNTDNDKGWNDVADYNIGDTVPFRLYGSLPSTYKDYDTYYYEFQDTLGKEFTVDKTSIKVYVNGNEVSRKNGNTLNWNAIVTETLDSDGLPSSATKINVYFADTKTIAPNSTDIITVEYNAVLNTNAEIGLPGQENEVKLVYSNNPNNSGSGTWATDNTPIDDTDDTPDKPKDSSDNEETGETPEDKVIVFTYELDITKVDGALYGDGKNVPDTAYLQNAKFLLYTSTTTGTDGKLVGDELANIYKDDSGNYVIINENGTVPNGYTKIDGSNDDAKLVTNSDGKIVIKGLDDGTYYLEETDAPAGYNELDALVKLEISANTQNSQGWTRTPSDALTPNDTATGKGGVSLTIDKDTSNISYSLYTSDGNNITDTGAVEALIKNNKGSTLPSTGGIGTTIFYMVGGVLVVGAGVTLIAKKRMKNDEQ